MLKSPRPAVLLATLILMAGAMVVPRDGAPATDPLRLPDDPGPVWWGEPDGPDPSTIMIRLPFVLPTGRVIQVLALPLSVRPSPNSFSLRPVAQSRAHHD